MHRFSLKFYTQFPFMVCFALLFIGLGYFLPKIYHQYFDRTEYIKFTQPVEVDKEEYVACSTVRLSTRATVAFPLQTKTVYVLERLDEDGSLVRVFTDSFESEFDKMNNGKLSKDFPIPCDIPPGKYFYSAVLSYRLDRAERAYRWYSDTFEVVR